MNTTSSSAILSLTLSLLAGAACVGSEDSSTPVDFGGGGGKADGDGDGLYAARLMQARCPGEECRGLSIRLVNRALTTCPDGTEAAACLVSNPSIDWSPTGFDRTRVDAISAKMPYGPGDDGAMTILVRAHYKDATLVIDEVWQEGIAGRVPTDEVVGVVQTADGLLLEQTLNLPGVSEIGDLDLDSAGLDRDQLAAIYAALPTGVILAGPSQAAGASAPVRTATQFWTRVAE